jgi:hypothetical protein
LNIKPIAGIFWKHLWIIPIISDSYEILKRKPTYGKLLDWILSYKPILIDTKKKLPDLKEIYKMAGIPYSHIGTDLRDIYFAIFKLNIADPRKFRDRDEKLCHLLN